MQICRTEKKSEVIDVEYKVCSDGYCCDPMKKWLEINNYHDRNTLLYNTKTNRFELRVKEYQDYGNNSNAVDEDFYFCPFCGEKLQDPIQPPETIIEDDVPKKKKFLRKKK